jgi:hypothetical protein
MLTYDKQLGYGLSQRAYDQCHHDDVISGQAFDQGNYVRFPSPLFLYHIHLLICYTSILSSQETTSSERVTVKHYTVRTIVELEGKT